MLAIDDTTKTISFNRGDIVDFVFRVTQGDSDYEFASSDYIRLNIVAKKAYTKGTIFSKKFICEEGESTVQIELTPAETKSICDMLDKAETFWYELVLNDNMTIIGYDSSIAELIGNEEGAKRLIVCPEGGEGVTD